MVRWIAFILFFLFILPAFADKKKKTENIQELDEKTRLEFDYYRGLSGCYRMVR